MVEVYEMQNVPAVTDYIRGLTAIRSHISDTRLRLFRIHYSFDGRTATAKQLATLAGISWITVNSHYGKLGHLLCDELGIMPELRPDSTYRWWSIWSRGWTTREGFVWQMLPQLAEALEQLGWVETFIRYPDEVSNVGAFAEGTVRRITVNAYERNETARQQCISHYGARCSVCQFVFGAFYGEIGSNYIHVHHLRQLSEIGQKYEVNPITDLRPVCPNCHAIIHRRNPPFSIEEVQAMIREQQI